uniref:Uncharacterized protein n=1 Tax=Clytia hemisphaerica TaxID=252671 RepID=A0A7M5VAJ1_9CNID
MARSLRSSRRKKNKQVLRERYKPKYDAQLQAIVANMQKETDELLQTSSGMDLESEIQTIDPDQMEGENMEDETETETQTTSSKDKIKLPKVDMAKVGKFMSQRKRRKYQRNLREKNKTAQKKVKSGGVQKKSVAPKIKW